MLKFLEKIKWYILVLFVGIILGSVLGYQTHDEVNTFFEEGKPIQITPEEKPDKTDSVPDIGVDEFPEHVQKPQKQTQQKTVKTAISYIVKTDSTYKNLYIEEKKYADSLEYENSLLKHELDTNALINDYKTIRTYYKWKLFDIDTIGSFQFDLSLQFNDVRSISNMIFTPVYKVIEKTQKERLIPFILVGYNTNKSIELGGGLFYNRLGVEYNYNINLNSDIVLQNIYINQKNSHSFKALLRF